VALDSSPKKSVKDVEVVVMEQDDNPHKRRLRPRKPKVTEAKPSSSIVEPAKKKSKIAPSRKRKAAETPKTEPATGVKRIKIIRSGTSKNANAQAAAPTTTTTTTTTTKDDKPTTNKERPIKDESSDDVHIIKSQRAVITIDSTDESSS
jgi:hypothetical protein